MAANSVKSNQGKRYTAEEKAEIAQYIEVYNAENKRGGMKSASEKFGVSVVTLSNWGKKNKGSKKRKARVKKVVKTAPVVKDVDENADAILNRLQAIRAEVYTLEKEYNLLKKKL